MKRERATELLQEMLDRLDEGRRPLDLVDEVHVFGSYARGALEPGDLDVAVVHRTDTEFAEDVVSAMMYGRDPMAGMKRALKGNRRGVQFQFNQNDSLPKGSELRLLWKRGDTGVVAKGRLQAMEADPAAGRAPRDAMIEQFEGLDRWVPLPVRIRLMELLDAGGIEIRRIRSGSLREGSLKSSARAGTGPPSSICQVWPRPIRERHAHSAIVMPRR